MSRRRDHDDLPKGLTHNPFAALRPDGAPAPKADEPSPAEQSSASPEGRLVVRREKKGRGGKTVTRISGLGDQDLTALARDLKRALGCGATVEEGDVLVQGAQVERAAAWLEQRFGRTVVRGN